MQGCGGASKQIGCPIGSSHRYHSLCYTHSTSRLHDYVYSYSLFPGFPPRQHHHTMWVSHANSSENVAFSPKIYASKQTQRATSSIFAKCRKPIDTAPTNNTLRFFKGESSQNANNVNSCSGLLQRISSSLKCAPLLLSGGLVHIFVALVTIRVFCSAEPRNFRGGSRALVYLKPRSTMERLRPRCA